MTEPENKPIFNEISPEQNAVEIESLCMQCHEKVHNINYLLYHLSQGVSRFLLTRIPHFRDIIIAAFECPFCGYHNNNIQSASAIADKGVRQSCLVSTPEVILHTFLVYNNV